MSAATSVAIAIIFTWIGVVGAISFLEAPLKFRAPGVTVRIGLGIGRLVFRAMNTVETVLAIILVVALALEPPAPVTVVACGLAVAVLAAQLGLVRPRLNRRSDAVLAGADAPRSRAHYAYVALEVAKFLALLVGGITVFAVT